LKRLVQISDCHLTAAAGDRLLGVDTDQSLQAVLDLLRRGQQPIDLLLLTGDLADSGGPDAYRRLSAFTRDLAPAVRWLPGNHDDLALLRQLLQGDSRALPTARLDNWLVITLDTPIPGEVGGRLDEAELARLAATLAAHPECHVAIALHHPVLPVGSAWLDAIAVANADAFWATIAPFTQVRLVLCGHVHMATDQMHRGVRVLTTPSTCVQFAPASEHFQLDLAAPGYRWIELHPDGRFDTGVERATDFPLQVDLDASGY
jgi:Icc protein